MIRVVLLSIALAGHLVAGQLDGCDADIPPTGTDQPCGPGGISASECNQLGCCMRDGQCTLWRGNMAVPQVGVYPTTSPEPNAQQTNSNEYKCSQFTISKSGGFDWAFTLDQNNLCQVYGQRWQNYRQDGTYTTDEDMNIVTYEHLTWHKRPRTAAENLGDRYDRLNSLYYGCYPAVVNGQTDIERQVWSSSKMTAETCIALCRAEGLPIAGVQGQNCKCTQSTLRLGEDNPSQCGTACGGDSNQDCGGSSSSWNAVYFAPPNPRFMGCYNDTSSLREYRMWSRNETTSQNVNGVPECIEACSLIEDISLRQYYHHYAFVADGGDCFCASQKWILDNSAGPISDPLACTGRCAGLGTSRPDEMCGSLGVAAAYSTFHNLPQRPPFALSPLDWHRPLVRRMRFTEADTLTVEDATMTGIPTNLFTFFPELRTILSSRIVIHASDAVLAPFEANRCQGGSCFDLCGDVYYDARVPADNRKTINLRFMFINLKNLEEYVGADVKRVFLYAQIVEITENIEFRFSISIRARQIIINRGTVQYLTVKPDTIPLVDDYYTFNDKSPETDLLFQRMVVGCARMLLQLGNDDDKTYAFEILDDIITDFAYDDESKNMRTAVRMTRAEYTGALRSDVRYVPFYGKSSLYGNLVNTAGFLNDFNSAYTDMLRDINNHVEFLNFADTLLGIYGAASISNWEDLFKFQQESVNMARYVYEAIHNNYTISADNLDVQKAAFETILCQKGSDNKDDCGSGVLDQQATQMFAFRRFRKLIRSIGRMAYGYYVNNSKEIEEDFSDEAAQLEALAETMEYLSKAMEQVNEMMEKMDYLMNILETVGNSDLEDVANDVEAIAELYLVQIGWKNMRHNAIILLDIDVLKQDSEVDTARKNYLIAILDTCNWGYELAGAMLELGESYRKAMLIKSMLETKYELQEDVRNYIASCVDNQEARYMVAWNVSDLSYDLRQDANELLLDFRSLYYYELQSEAGVVPLYNVSLELVRLRLQTAIGANELWNGPVPGDVKRSYLVSNTDNDPNCEDPVVCPITVFRNTRRLTFEIPETEFTDLLDFRVGNIVVDVINAKPGPSGNRHLKMNVESTTPFGLRKDGGTTRDSFIWFMTRPLKLTWGYNVPNTDDVMDDCTLYHTTTGNIHHRSPFTTWTFGIADNPSADIDISDVQNVRITFGGISSTFRDGDQ